MCCLYSSFCEVVHTNEKLENDNRKPYVSTVSRSHKHTEAHMCVYVCVRWYRLMLTRPRRRREATLCDRSALFNVRRVSISATGNMDPGPGAFSSSKGTINPQTKKQRTKNLRV